MNNKPPWGSDRNDFIFNLIGQFVKIRHAAEREKAEIDAQKSINPHYTKKPDPLFQNLLALIAIAVIALFGAEPVKVIFRKNFGRNAILLPCLLVTCLLFIAIGLFGLVVGIGAMMGMIPNSGEFFEIDSSFSYAITGIFYICLGIYALMNGFHKHETAQKSSLSEKYQGDSYVFNFLKQNGWNWETWMIQKIAEPLSVVLIGICFSLYINIYGGIPIVICGLSLWVSMAVEVLFIKNTRQEKVKRMNAQMNADDRFEEVDPD